MSPSIESNTERSGVGGTGRSASLTVDSSTSLRITMKAAEVMKMGCCAGHVKRTLPRPPAPWIPAFAGKTV